jgi:hypothetical protein
MKEDKDQDFIPGNPEHVVLGKPEEKPAFNHKPTPPRGKPTLKTIRADVKRRMWELKPMVDEAEQLEKALDALKNL